MTSFSAIFLIFKITFYNHCYPTKIIVSNLWLFLRTTIFKNHTDKTNNIIRKTGFHCDARKPCYKNPNTQIAARKYQGSYFGVLKHYWLLNNKFLHCQTIAIGNFHKINAGSEFSVFNTHNQLLFTVCKVPLQDLLA